MGDWCRCGQLGGQIWDTFAQFMKAQKPPCSHAHTLSLPCNSLKTQSTVVDGGGNTPASVNEEDKQQWWQTWSSKVSIVDVWDLFHLGESEPPSGYQGHSPVWPVSIPVVESLFFTQNRTRVILVPHSLGIKPVRRLCSINQTKTETQQSL